MFDGLKNLGAMASLMKDLPKLQARMQEVRETLSEIRVSATSTDGTVEVIAAGDLTVQNVQIAGDCTDAAALQEGIRQATNEALEGAKAEAQRRLSAVAEELGLPGMAQGQLPGMGM